MKTKKKLVSGENGRIDWSLCLSVVCRAVVKKNISVVVVTVGLGGDRVVG